MRKILGFILLLFLFSLPLFFAVKADINSDIENLGKQIDALNKNIASAQVSHQKLVDQLNGIKNSIISLETQIQKKEEEVKQGEQALLIQKNQLNERVKSYYKNVGQSSLSLVDVLVAENLSDSLQKFFYQKSLVDQDRNMIIKIVLYIKNLEEIKSNLQTEKNQLALLKVEVDKQSKTLEAQISQMQQQVAALSAQQQQLIAQKLASLNIPQSAYVGLGGGCSSDLTNGKNPGFSPHIGFFTYGVPNRVGLNQYGAKGRAESGQNAESILSAYYQNYNLDKNYNDGINITVSGTNDYGQSINQSYNIEEYLKHVYEMPSNWPQEALKAQAIAARSYALAATGNGSSPICPNQHCQEVKQEENSDSWKQAVDATKGWVMTNNGSPVSAYYSSTHGGYVYDSSSGISNRPWLKNGQDTSSGVNNFSDLNNNAYDKSSPWFYCDWGSRSEYGGTAWLRQDEVADIVNVLMLVKADSSTAEHLYQTDKSNPAGTDTWNSDRVKQELKNRGIQPYNNVTDVSISADFGSGKTTGVSVSGDAGTKSFDAADFKNYFNLRAPANIQIVGPLFNAEKG